MICGIYVVIRIAINNMCKDPNDPMSHRHGDGLLPNYDRTV